MNAKEQWLLDVAAEAVDAVITHLRAHYEIGEEWDKMGKVLQSQVTEECEDLVVDVLEERAAGPTVAESR